MRAPEPLEISGVQPALEGLGCEALVAQQYWRDGLLDEQVNVAHLKFGGEWHRLYFDHGIVYWRRSEHAPEPFDAPELHADYPLLDIAAAESLLGRTLLAIETSAHAHGSQVVLAFSGAKSITFDCTGDRTSYST